MLKYGRWHMSKNTHTPLTIAEARAILGTTYDKYPDDYIQAMIHRLDGIAEAFIKSGNMSGIE
jgi:hypothetical protein